MSEFITSEQAAVEMKSITRAITDNVFSIDDVGMLIIHATGMGNAADACAQVSYELCDEDEYLEFLEEPII